MNLEQYSAKSCLKEHPKKNSHCAASRIGSNRYQRATVYVQFYFNRLNIMVVRDHEDQSLRTAA
jgi:hypothetical protein